MPKTPNRRGARARAALAASVLAASLAAASDLGLVRTALASSPYAALGFVGDGTSLDWRHDPVRSWTTERPVSLWNETDYEERCQLAISCLGDFDLSTDARARMCGNITGGTVRISGPLRHPPVCLTDILAGSIEIVDNPFITSMNGFGRLRTVSGNITLERNPALVSLGGLDTLTSVGGDLIVRHCGDALAMTRLDDLVVQERFFQDNLDSFVADDDLHFPRRKAQRADAVAVEVDPLGTAVFAEDEIVGLRSLHGLGSLTSVGGDLIIVSNTELRDLRGAAQLAHVAGSFFLRQNLLLNNVEGLDGLLEISGSFIVDANPGLTSLAGFRGLEHVGGDWTISQNERLAELGALARLTSVEGAILLSRNEELVQISQQGGSLGLVDVGGGLVIDDNRRLASLEGLNNLARVDGSFIVGRVPELAALSAGLGALAQVGGDFYVQGEMESYAGLEALQRVEGSLVVHSMPSLTSLDGLQALTHVGEDVLIYVNTALRSVGELESLAHVGGRIRIYENDDLAEAQGLLAALAHVGDYVRITFANGTVDCPLGTGLSVGELPLIYDTTAEDPLATEASAATTSYGNWCTFNCKYPKVVSPPGQPRMWQTQTGQMWDSSQGPFCL